jgi:hypothetical protein
VLVLDAPHLRSMDVPLRLVAAYALMAIRDGADHLFIEPDPDPAVEGLAVQCRIAGERSDLAPPPLALFAQLRAAVLTGAADPHAGCIEWRIGGELVRVFASVQPGPRGERIGLHFPVRPDLAGTAGAVLTELSDAAGLMEFEFPW